MAALRTKKVRADAPTLTQPAQPLLRLPLLLAAAVMVVLVGGANAKYIESVAANVDGVESTHDAKADAAAAAGSGGGAPSKARKHEAFVPLVAFQCGYRNKFADADGKWRDDASSAATCLQGKYDILKYCKRVYPNLEVTNVVEYSHTSHIGAWCREDGGNCRRHFAVRPYRCIVGEFVSESLQVPPRCRFSHISGHAKCNDYKYWSLKAESECGLKTEDDTQQSMKLHSFSILDPCGLSMFRGVEFVCCPKSVEDKIEHVVDLDKDTDEDEYEDDEDEDESSEDEDENASQRHRDGDDDEDADGKGGKKALIAQDPYFKEDAASGASEHDRFRDAEERLEKKHRRKVTKVITEWSELFERYNKMKAKDAKGAEEYKREMTARFRKTVAALEEENREQRTQLEELHDERVQSALNEKKRQATHDYRAALAKQVGGANGAPTNKNNVLKTLKNYIKAEERDRTHMLNRYRHLLRADPEAAISFEPILLHRLRYIDLRVNGTLAMLHDFPRLERQVRPLALEFWESYRRENTPEAAVADEAARAAGGSLLAGGTKASERLVRLYKRAYQRAHTDDERAVDDAPLKADAGKLAVDRAPMAAAAAQKKTSAASQAKEKARNSAPSPANRVGTVAQKSTPSTRPPPSTTRAPLPEDSDEDQFDDDDEDESVQDDLIEKDEKAPKTSAKFDQKVDKTQKVIEKAAKKLPLDDEDAKKPKALKTLATDDESDEEDNSDDDADDDDDAEADDDDDAAASDDDDDSDAKSDADLSIAIEPIHGAPIRVHEEPAYSRRHDALVAYNAEFNSESSASGPLAALAQWANRTNFALGMLACACVVLLVGVLAKRRAARHPGFVEVDVCTPEERHVAGLQVNGYENPTYAHFDSKA